VACWGNAGQCVKVLRKCSVNERRNYNTCICSWLLRVSAALEELEAAQEALGQAQVQVKRGGKIMYLYVSTASA
jgi:hypothetical protein